MKKTKNQRSKIKNANQRPVNRADMTKGEDRQEFRNRVYRFSVDVIRFTNDIPLERKVNYALIDQLIRAGTSIGANVIEARSCSSKKEFSRYFEMALKSANETKYWLCLFRDALEFGSEIKQLLKEADEISKILAGSILTMKGKRQ